MPAVLTAHRPAEAAKSAMDAKTVNPFIIAAVQVIKENTDLTVAKENIFVQQGKFTPAGTGLVIDVSGALKGKVVYEFSKGVAVRISQKMVQKHIDMRTTAMDFKEMLNAAILELGNQITGKAITLMADAGNNCTMSPPQFYLGQDLQLIHPHLKTIVLVLRTEYGNFSINVALYR